MQCTSGQRPSSWAGFQPTTLAERNSVSALQPVWPTLHCESEVLIGPSEEERESQEFTLLVSPKCIYCVNPLQPEEWVLFAMREKKANIPV